MWQDKAQLHVKSVLNGKIKGKPRASSSFVSVGTVPESSLMENIVNST